MYQEALVESRQETFANDETSVSKYGFDTNASNYSYKSSQLQFGCFLVAVTLYLLFKKGLTVHKTNM